MTHSKTGPVLKPNSAAIESHLSNLRIDGMTRIKGAIPQPLLQRCQSRFAALLESNGQVRAGLPMALEVRRVLESDPCFADLMDLPAVLPLIDAWFQGDITLADGGIAQTFFGRSPAQGGWHRDGDTSLGDSRGIWLRCAFLLSDVEEERGPTAFIAGTHYRSSGPPDDWNQSNGQPLAQKSERYGTGHSGDCIVNVTSIWHTSTPNRTADERRLVWLLYKPSREAQWDKGDLGYSLTENFATAQSDSRRALLCGRFPEEPRGRENFA
jgi:ectoine hydroxylase